MATNNCFPRSGFERGGMPLDAVRAAFEWLVTGPEPVSVDGRLFPGLPGRRVPLNEVRDRLLHRRCPQALRDAVWRHLVLLSRTEGATWTVGCAGVALPALTTIAATLSARFAGDPSDLHAAVLAGFVAELATIDLRKPRVMLRLRWAAYRAGHAGLRESLDAPVPSGNAFCSVAPPPPWGHPDFVLARAVAEGAITGEEAELIASTRLEGVPLATAAQRRDLSYEAVKKVRQRAEHRLVAYLADDTATEPNTGHSEPDVARRATDIAVITGAGNATEEARNRTQPTTAAGTKRVRRRVSRKGRHSGVQGCGRKPATSPHDTSPDRPAALSQRPSGLTSESPRCA
ncbi:hypothetical protein [Amycolatopsis pigmentata]|uniref:Sigma-70 family RNA polymerase sigma factor n=1 Tax=Amycolatopsis pigmentata TaxID=450801 RepID=A0ABW5FMB4_9PSEU